MALGFIKKVFSFGKDKPAASEKAEGLTAEERVALSAETEPHGRVEDLPVSTVDPVADIEMETAGGPADDDLGDEEPVLLAPADMPGDLGMVPLSLLEAEAEEEAVAETSVDVPAIPPSALPGISPSGGRSTRSTRANPLRTLRLLMHSRES